MFTQDDFRGRGQWQGQGRLHNLCNQGCDQEERQIIGRGLLGQNVARKYIFVAPI